MRKKRMNSIFISLLLASSFLVMVSMTDIVKQDPQPPQWDVPAKYVSMTNPVKADQESLKTGAMLYRKYCASCHGKEGKGDGVKARMLKTFSGDFSKASYQEQTDGEMFYKTEVGRDEMPGYENKLSDKDMWHIVNYMRTFDD
jgi:mono/diheme cytochrome c family protein